MHDFTTVRIPGNAHRGDVELVFSALDFELESVENAGYTGRPGWLLRQRFGSRKAVMVPDSNDKEFTFYESPDMRVTQATQRNHTCHTVAFRHDENLRVSGAIFIRFYDELGLVRTPQAAA